MKQKKIIVINGKALGVSHIGHQPERNELFLRISDPYHLKDFSVGDTYEIGLTEGIDIRGKLKQISHHPDNMLHFELK